MLENSSPIDSIIFMIALFWSLCSVFLVCELSERLTIRCESLEDAFYGWPWYSFSNDMQKWFVIVIANAQQTPIIKGFGNVPCTRESFKSVSGNPWKVPKRKNNIQCSFFIWVGRILKHRKLFWCCLSNPIQPIAVDTFSIENLHSNWVVEFNWVTHFFS